MKIGIEYLGVFILFLFACSSEPSSKDAQKVFTNIQSDSAKGDFRIAQFKKINSLKRELMGTELREVEYEVTIEFLTKIWEIDQERLRQEGFSGLVDTRILHLTSDSIRSIGPEEGMIPLGCAIPHDKGEKTTRKGTMVFEKTEKGWRGEDGNIY